MATGAEIAGYRIERVLATGGTSTFYLARNSTLPRPDALKVLDANSPANPASGGGSAARPTSSRASPTPTSCRCTTTAKPTTAWLWIAMQYVADAVTPERAIRIVIEIAEALDCPHSRGVGYQHVKPSDVLLSAVGEHVLLTGFGVVRTRGHIEVITDDSTSSALARRAPSLQGRAELRSWPVRGYGTAVRFDGDEAAHRAADASQGAYFRAELVARRVHLEDTIIKRRALIERRAYAANLRADVRSAEIEVGILSRLIAGLDRRFAAYWASDELAL